MYDLLCFTNDCTIYYYEGNKQFLTGPGQYNCSWPGLTRFIILKGSLIILYQVEGPGPFELDYCINFIIRLLNIVSQLKKFNYKLFLTLIKGKPTYQG